MIVKFSSALSTLIVCLLAMMATLPAQATTGATNNSGEKGMEICLIVMDITGKEGEYTRLDLQSCDLSVLGSSSAPNKIGVLKSAHQLELGSPI